MTKSGAIVGGGAVAMTAAPGCPADAPRYFSSSIAAARRCAPRRRSFFAVWGRAAAHESDDRKGDNAVNQVAQLRQNH